MSFLQQEREGLTELTGEAESRLSSSKYYNADLAPTKLSQRKWKAGSVTSLWIGMGICIPSLALASSLVLLGVSPLLSIINVVLGNLIVLIPIQLNSHVGTKYGIPFPVFARLTFGKRGAQLPAIARSFIACGWASVQAWTGGGALAAIIALAIPSLKEPDNTVAMPGNDSVPVGQLVGFAIFMLIVFLVAYNGVEKIRWVQNIGGPILVVMVVALFGWSVASLSEHGSSLIDVFAAGNDWDTINANGGFAFIYMAGLTANISYWATMALNIPDFSRFAKSQKDQFRGQLFGMPTSMAVCAVIGVVFARASAYYTPDHMPSFDPTSVFYYIDNPFVVLITGLGVVAATVTTCVAANVVSPANGFSNINPSRISFKKGVVITVLFATFVTQPWMIYGSGSGYIFNWLNNYGTVIAPVAAILIADYYVAKKKRINVVDLYSEGVGTYTYKRGWNINAFIAWGVSVVIPLLGNTVFSFGASKRSAPGLFDYLAANGYLLSFVVAFGVYCILMRAYRQKENYGFVSVEKYRTITKEVC